MKHSILIRTTCLVTVVTLIMFVGIFSVIYSRSIGAMKTQALSYVGENLKTSQLSLDSLLASYKLSMYRYSQSIDKLSSKADAVRTFDLYHEMDSGAGVQFLANRDEILAITSPILLASIKTDLSFYYELASKKRIVTTKPFYSPLTASRTIALIQYIPVADFQEGLLNVTEIRTASLFQASVNRLNQYETLLALTTNGETVYLDPYTSILGKLGVNEGLIDISTETRSILTALPIGTNQVEIGGRELIIRHVRYEQSWDLYFIVEAESYFIASGIDVSDQLRMTMPYPFLIIAVAILVSALIVRPVRELKKNVDALEPAGESHVALVSHRKDEIGSLAESFNALIERLGRADEEKYLLEYKVLQSQIQPHFLFNVHLCIAGLIEQGRPEEALKMLQKLDGLLRECTDKTQNIITLSHEMKLLNDYLELQQIRTGDSFCLMIDPYESYANVALPKLLLQPIVENAIYHGILGLDRRGEIHISFDEIDGYLHIFIEDNGRGIPEDTLIRLAKEEQNEDNKRGMVSIGIGNVRKRILSIFGEPCGLYLSSSEGLGTIVEIVVPMQFDFSGSTIQ